MASEPHIIAFDGQTRHAGRIDGKNKRPVRRKPVVCKLAPSFERGQKKVTGKMGIRQLDTVRKVNGARAAGAAPARISGLNELQVRLPASCSKCSCVIALISRENNGHSLRCACCGAPLGCVSNAAERFLQKFVELFGRPTKPIEIHHHS